MLRCWLSCPTLAQRLLWEPDFAPKSAMFGRLGASRGQFWPTLGADGGRGGAAERRLAGGGRRKASRRRRRLRGPWPPSAAGVADAWATASRLSSRAAGRASGPAPMCAHLRSPLFLGRRQWVRSWSFRGRSMPGRRSLERAGRMWAPELGTGLSRAAGAQSRLPELA